MFNNASTTGPDKLAEALAAGATIVDVRTPEEYEEAHVSGSINIPLHELPDALDRLAEYESIVVCCRSGARSAQAESYLRSKGIQRVMNGGGWMEVNSRKRS